MLAVSSLEFWALEDTNAAAGVIKAGAYQLETVNVPLDVEVGRRQGQGIDEGPRNLRRGKSL